MPLRDGAILINPSETTRHLLLTAMTKKKRNVQLNDIFYRTAYDRTNEVQDFVWSSRRLSFERGLLRKVGRLTYTLHISLDLFYETEKR